MTGNSLIFDKKQFVALESRRDVIFNVGCYLLVLACLIFVTSFFSFSLDDESIEKSIKRSLAAQFIAPANDDVPQEVLHAFQKQGLYWNNANRVLNRAQLPSRTNAYLLAQWLLINNANDDLGRPLPVEAQLALLKSNYDVLAETLAFNREKPFYRNDFIYLIETRLFKEPRTLGAKAFESTMRNIGIPRSMVSHIRLTAAGFGLLAAIAFAIFALFDKRVKTIASLSLKAAKFSTKAKQQTENRQSGQDFGRLTTQLFEESVSAFNQRTTKPIRVDFKKDDRGRYINNETTKSLTAFQEANAKQLTDDSFMRSMLWGFTADSALLGYAAGGNFAGAVGGALASDLLKSDSLRADKVSPYKNGNFGGNEFDYTEIDNSSNRSTHETLRAMTHLDRPQDHAVDGTSLGSSMPLTSNDGIEGRVSVSNVSPGGASDFDSSGTFDAGSTSSSSTND